MIIRVSCTSVFVWSFIFHNMRSHNGILKPFSTDDLLTCMAAAFLYLFCVWEQMQALEQKYVSSPLLIAVSSSPSVLIVLAPPRCLHGLNSFCLRLTLFGVRSQLSLRVITAAHSSCLHPFSSSLSPPHPSRLLALPHPALPPPQSL